MKGATCFKDIQLTANKSRVPFNIKNLKKTILSCQFDKELKDLQFHLWIKLENKLFLCFHYNCTFLFKTEHWEEMHIHVSSLFTRYLIIHIYVCRCSWGQTVRLRSTLWSPYSRMQPSAQTSSWIRNRNISSSWPITWYTHSNGTLITSFLYR